MSSISISPAAASSDSSSRSVEWGPFAILAFATLAAASIANVLVYFAADAIIGFDSRFVQLGGAFGIVIFTAGPAVIAALLYAVLLRKAANPARTFTIVSAVIFVLSLVPDFTFIQNELGVTNARTAVLVLMHVVAAMIIVGMLTTFSRRKA
jgi:hypothetical protein